jgi:hypothetical protein
MVRYFEFGLPESGETSLKPLTIVALSIVLR